MNYNSIFVVSNLPKPLKEEELLECISKAQEGDLQARDKAIIHNIRLVLNQVRKKFTNTPYDTEDLVSIGNMGLLKAVNTFDITKKTHFTTYATKCIDNEILMFMRKDKKNLVEESLNQPFHTNKDGSELKIEDTISDENINFNENIINQELLLETRKQVDLLEGKDKEIAKLYFGFYNNKLHSQEEISKMMGLSQSYVSRIIKRVINVITKRLKEQNLIEGVKEGKRVHRVMRNSTKERKGTTKMSRKLQTIYEYLNEYTKEQIDDMIEKLSQEEKELLTLRYGEDLNNPQKNEKWSKENNAKFYGCLIPKMKKMLSNPNNDKRVRPKTKNKECLKEKDDLNSSIKPEYEITKEKQDVERIKVLPNEKTIDDSITKGEYIKILKLLRTPTFTQMMELLSPKDAIIISLKLGYIDGKYFSTESIARFLGMEEFEVIETTKNVLLLYKENINKFIDDAVRIVTEEPKTLSLDLNTKN